MEINFIIVGAGFAGCTFAERIATQLGKTVLLVEKRNHIGGNAYDYYNEYGILVQKYGPHIFHTSLQEVWNYLSTFTEWNGYVHRVIAKVNGKEVYLPINIDTMERLHGSEFTPKKLKDYFEERRVKLKAIRNSKDVIVSQIGEELYELFFRNYTKKQWGVYPDKLSPDVLNRLPVRFNRDTRYFTDRYQGMPKYGYTKMFEKMINQSNIHLLLNTDYKTIIKSVKYKRLIFTGPIDYYFDYVQGKLPYRSLDFRFKTLNMGKYQNAAVVNYPNNYDFTRITEFKHFYFQKNQKTTICYEYPKTKGDPYYPILRPANVEIYKKYRERIAKIKNVYFLGRLAQYTYFNMDQVVAESLKLFKSVKKG